MANSENFRKVLTEMGLDYKKNKLKKLWRSLPEPEQKKIVNGDFSSAKNTISLQIMDEPWDTSENFQKRWRKHTGQTKQEFADLCAELERML